MAVRGWLESTIKNSECVGQKMQSVLRKAAEGGRCSNPCLLLTLPRYTNQWVLGEGGGKLNLRNPMKKNVRIVQTGSLLKKSKQTIDLENAEGHK